MQNSGVITAKLGKVQLESGDSFTLDLYGDGLMEIKASDAINQQLIQNTGTIDAAGGTVQITAAAGRKVVNSLVNFAGEVDAPTFQEHNGTISIYAEGSNAVQGNVAANKGQKQGTSTVLVSGKLDASGKQAGQTGGTISVLGDHVGILSGALIDDSGTRAAATSRSAAISTARAPRRLRSLPSCKAARRSKPTPSPPATAAMSPSGPIITPISPG